MRRAHLYVLSILAALTVVSLTSCSAIPRSANICGNDGSFTHRDRIETRSIRLNDRHGDPGFFLSTNNYRVFVTQRDLLDTLSAAPPGPGLTSLQSAIEADLPLRVDTDIARYHGDSPALILWVTWAYAELVAKGLASISNLERNPAGEVLPSVVVTHLDGHGQFRIFCEPPNHVIFEHADELE